MEDIKLKLNIFKENNIKVFLKVNYDNKNFSKHNGFIREIKEDYILLEDTFKGLVPILIKDILKVDKSKFQDGI